MAKTKKSKSSKSAKTAKSESKVTVSRPTKKEDATFLTKVQSDLENRNALLNLILGVLIVIIVGVLIFNYFNRARDLGPSSNIETTTDTSGDVTKANLPGNYTVKADDTLFTIAEKYYDSGWEYVRIVEANNVSDPDNLAEGQVLIIPKAEAQAMQPSPNTSTDSATTEPIITTEAVSTPSATPTPTVAQTVDPTTAPVMQPSWGNKIEGDTYTVQAGDWLSTIAARTYNGDLMAYEKIAKANNLTNPDLIEIGQVLKLPR